ncbi:MAG: pilus assembly PilX N-terminal domain-containing protein [Xanthomonadales bacterium]|nr:pilus assembly PilX N-terminal domain-containing protein [Xanthomonadales bacterium]
MVVLILVIMTVMLFFNARVTSFEQIISGNDRRAKLAHHVAEAGISHAMRFFTRNIRDIGSIEASGWLPGSPGANQHWLPCSADDTTLPCAAASLEADGRADGFNRENVYYYVEDPDAETLNTYLPLQALVTEYDDSDPPVAIDNTGYKVQALLCVMDYDQDKYDPGNVSTYAKCSDSGTPDGINVAIRVISTGTSDDGSAEAVITQTLANVEPGGGPPSVPIMSFNSIAPNGNLNVVVNPNASGIGVPTSIWSRNYAYIEEPGGGSVATCELEEFLLSRDSSNWRSWTDADGVVYETCDSCTCPDKEDDGALSHTQSTDPPRKYFDIVDEDPDYPDDIFEYYFGVARTEYHQVRDAADEVLEDCSSVDVNTRGLVWVDGYCQLAGKEVGSAIAPVALVTTKGLSLNSNTIMYGVLVITDPDIPPEDQAEDAIPVTLNGGPVVYGAVMSDPGAATFNGGFTVVYVTDILTKIHPLIILGNLPGSWTDQVTFN